MTKANTKNEREPDVKGGLDSHNEITMFNIAWDVFK